MFTYIIRVKKAIFKNNFIYILGSQVLVNLEKEYDKSPNLQSRSLQWKASYTSLKDTWKANLF